MLADDVHDGNLRAARVVQIRHAISQARSEMQQCARRFFSHARVAVCRSGNDTFEETKDATISVTRSSAATMCISEVPGFVKQVSTPPAISVRIRLSAPFILVGNYLSKSGFENPADDVITF